jgi:RNA polymerase sigma-70 factor (ECF subfamily)
MLWHEGETTDRALLDRLGDWADRTAWSEFVRRYDPEIRRHCRAYRFDPETLEEVCQRIWIELARCLRTYRYDPGRRFRAWLRRLCRSRAIDLWRQRQAEAQRRAGDVPLDDLAAPSDLDVDDAADQDRPALLRRAECVQEAVRRRVDDRTWQVFWSIAVEGEAVRETAEAAGLSYAAAFAAQKRVRRMLREESARLEPAADAEAGP